MSRLRIGLTLRSVNNVEYPELRDAISHDWYHFFDKAQFDVDWILIPNLGAAITSYIKDLGLKALIFSGGNDVGFCPERDLTERELLRFAIDNRVPVLGVCRGLQLIHTYFGGALTTLSNSSHVRLEHEVVFTEKIVPPFLAGYKYSVNSYHNQVIAKDSISEKFKTLAVSADGFVECMQHIELPIAGVMWHPERRPVLSSDERKLLKHFLFGEII